MNGGVKHDVKKEKHLNIGYNIGVNLEGDMVRKRLT